MIQILPREGVSGHAGRSQIAWQGTPEYERKMQESALIAGVLKTYFEARDESQEFAELQCKIADCNADDMAVVLAFADALADIAGASADAAGATAALISQASRDLRSSSDRATASQAAVLMRSWQTNPGRPMVKTLDRLNGGGHVKGGPLLLFSALVDTLSGVQNGDSFEEIFVQVGGSAGGGLAGGALAGAVTCSAATAGSMTLLCFAGILAGSYVGSEVGPGLTQRAVDGLQQLPGNFQKSFESMGRWR